MYLRAFFEHDHGFDAVKYLYASPKEKTIKGLRLRIGWFFIRFGAYILYGNNGTSETKHGKDGDVE